MTAIQHMSMPTDMTETPLAARLRSAREACGLTQAQAAAELGVSRPLLISIEKGSREVQPSELVKLAEIYGIPVSNLLRPTAPPLAIGARLRAALASVPENKDLTDAINQLEAHADDYLEILNHAHAEPPGRDIPVRSIKHMNVEQAGEDLAIEERNRLGLGDGPIQYLREVLEIEVGLRIFVLPLPARVAGLFVYVELLGACVAVNERHPAERKRWTMAHEYAHLLVSRGQAEVTPIGPQRRAPDSERFADAFAANFLMPRNGLVRRFHELRRGKDGKMPPAVVVQLAHSYRVSVQALTLRLEDLGLVRSGTWDQLRDSSFQLRTAVRKLGLGPPDTAALPVHYRILAAQLYADGEITETQLARYLHTDIVGARREYGRITGSYDVSEDGSLQIVDLAESAE